MDFCRRRKTLLLRTLVVAAIVLACAWLCGGWCSVNVLSKNWIFGIDRGCAIWHTSRGEHDFRGSLGGGLSVSWNDSAPNWAWTVGVYSGFIVGLRVSLLPVAVLCIAMRLVFYWKHSHACVRFGRPVRIARLSALVLGVSICSSALASHWYCVEVQRHEWKVVVARGGVVYTSARATPAVHGVDWSITRVGIQTVPTIRGVLFESRQSTFGMGSSVLVSLWAAGVTLLGAAGALWYVADQRTRWPTLCKRCGYDLVGLDGRSACPECGCRAPDVHRRVASK